MIVVAECFICRSHRFLPAVCESHHVQHAKEERASGVTCGI